MPRITQRWLLAAGGAMLITVATAAGASTFASDMDGPDDIKQKACAAIGCGGGKQPCADAKGSIKVGKSPWEGSVEVTYHCYQKEGSEE